MIAEARRYDEKNNVTLKDKLEWCLRPFEEWFNSAQELRAYIKERAMQRIRQRIAAQKNKYVIDATTPAWDSRRFDSKHRASPRNNKVNRRHREAPKLK
jgi:hypothetical protein